MPQNTVEPQPRVVSAYGNASQLVLATLPLLGVFIYFLYEAAVRPNQPIYALGVDVDDDVAVSEAWDETPPMIPLSDMIPVFLSFQGVFTIFFLYLLIFIPRRRTLLRSYLEKGETCLGDVVYDDKTPGLCASRANQYGEVVYAYPNTTAWTVRKRVRVYQHYSRERVTILRLLNRPFSGQPKADIQIDLQSSKAAAPAVKFLTVFALCWIVFTFLSPIFILYQISKLNHDDYEDFDKALDIYLIVGIGILPLFSLLLVTLRWALYRHWIVNRGWLLKHEGDESLGMGAQDEGVVGVFMGELVGKHHPEELSRTESFGSLLTYGTGTQASASVTNSSTTGNSASLATRTTV
jgi:hypothetical protein